MLYQDTYGIVFGMDNDNETPSYAPKSTDPLQSQPTLPEQPPEPESILSEHEGAKSIISTIAILVTALLIALSLTIYVFQSYEVDGPSMETTLQNRDRLIVYKLSRTIARISGHPYIPNRGDIVIFSRKDSYEFGTNQKRQLIKRVIAIPGERVVVKAGVLTVYNKQHPEGFRPDDAAYGKVIVTTPGEVDLTVKDNELYVCGDNRPNSLDSRSFGPISTDDIVGKLILRVYPFNKGQSF